MNNLATVVPHIDEDVEQQAQQVWTAMQNARQRGLDRADFRPLDPSRGISPVVRGVLESKGYCVEDAYDVARKTTGHTFAGHPALNEGPGKCFVIRKW